ncbi:hypothetical protein DRN69_00490 [Candidatus Pacearchaeota archaeon]|nr:MAG: hypothetical protein DRN69_00490 [Candidatus Pacearchaeota archaeon]
MNYKEFLFGFLKDKMKREYCLPIVRKLLQANFRKGKYIIKTSDRKLEILPEEIEEKIEEICEFIVEKALKEGYSALIVPFIVSKEQAPNFYITEEKPREEELWWWLYHLLTGIHYRDFAVNLANIPKEINEEFRKYLINENFLIFEAEKSGLNINEMLSRLEVPKGIPLKEFILGFIFVSYFAKFWRNWKEKENIAGTMGKEIPRITDEASLVIFVLPRQKKRIYVLPKLRKIISYWYSDFSEKDIPQISKFIFSFYIADKNYKKESAGLLNKFLYSFLQEYINGELLEKSIELKTSYELKKKGRIYGISNAKQFFSKL